MPHPLTTGWDLRLKVLLGISRSAKVHPKYGLSVGINLHAEERKYQLGNSTVFFVLDAQTQLAQAGFALAQAPTGYQTALAAVDHATGKLLEHHQVKLAPRGTTK